MLSRGVQGFEVGFIWVFDVVDDDSFMAAMFETTVDLKF